MLCYKLYIANVFVPLFYLSNLSVVLFIKALCIHFAEFTGGFVEISRLHCLSQISPVMYFPLTENSEVVIDLICSRCAGVLYSPLAHRKAP